MQTMKFVLLCLSLLSVSLACSCSADQSTPEKQAGHPVEWYAGLTLPQYLANPFNVRTHADVAALLNKKWYGAFQVHATDEAPTETIASCNEYFRAAQKPLQTVKESEYGPFRFMVMMCLATRATSQARASRISTFSKLVFDKNLPAKLPAPMAMIISSTERQRILSDKAIRHMSQVHRIIKLKRHSRFDVDYAHEGGSQQLQLVARGDFNHDGVEDYLISSLDSVVGGSYSAMRLFLITRKPGQGDYSLIKEFND